MKKRISATALALVFSAGSAFASAYSIPEQSIDSTAKAGANISSAEHADASYFNPANMSWVGNAWQAEADLNYLHLSSTKYKDTRGSLFDGSTKEENFLIPTFFLISPSFNNFRFGLSMTEPFNLATRWNGEYPRSFFGKFDVKVYEFNPTVSYKINSIFSVAAGVRMLYSTAGFASGGLSAPFLTLSQDMDADTTAWGYNLAVSARPTAQSNISVTYRSNADLDFDGNATFNDATSTLAPAAARGHITVATPAVLAVSGAYTFLDKLTVELTWDRTFWSTYKTLDFNYDTPPSVYTVYFGDPAAKNYKDSNAYRLGLSYKATKVMTLMAGIAYDETPVPSGTLGFELPDSDAWLFSLGARFKVTSQMDLGIGLLYDRKADRSVNNANVTGKFSDASSFSVSAGMSYTF